MGRLLVVVDYQNDFVSGSLGFPSAAALERPILEKISSYRAAGDEVVYTMDTHDHTYLSTKEGERLPVVHCVQGESGWELYGGLKAALEGCKGFFKGAFGSLELCDYVRARTYQSIELCGLVSNICVLTNALLLKTAAPEAEIIVDATATDTADPALQNKTLDVLESVQVTVTNRR